MPPPVPGLPTAARSPAPKPTSTTEPAESPTTKAATPEPTSPETAPANREGQNYRPAKPASPTTPTPAAATAPRKQRKQDESENQPKEEVPAATIRGAARLRKGRQVPGELKAKAFSVLLAQRGHRKQNSTAEIALPEAWHQKLVTNAPGLSGGDERVCAEPGLDLQLPLTRYDEHDHAGVPGGVTRFTGLAHLPLAPNLQSHLVPGATLQGRKSDHHDLTTGLGLYFLDYGVDPLFGLRGDHSREVVHVPDRRGQANLRIARRCDERQQRRLKKPANPRTLLHFPMIIPGLEPSMRRTYALFLFVSFGALGCGGDPEVTVEATLPRQGAAAPVADMPVRLLPYNRDSIIAGLRQKAAKPEPQVPPELIARIDSLQGVTARARAGDTLNVARERTLRTLRAQVDSIRAARQEWSDETLKGFNEAVQARLETLGGVQELADTTGADGRVTFRAPEGRWWVFARYLLPDRELYWNIPIQIQEQSATVRLTAENAQARPAGR